MIECLHILRGGWVVVTAAVDLRTLQAILGHTCLQTTTWYLHVSNRHLHQTPSLLERLMLPAVAAVPVAATEERG